MHLWSKWYNQNHINFHIAFYSILVYLYYSEWLKFVNFLKNPTGFTSLNSRTHSLCSAYKLCYVTKFTQNLPSEPQEVLRVGISRGSQYKDHCLQPAYYYGIQSPKVNQRTGQRGSGKACRQLKREDNQRFQPERFFK